MDCCDYAPYTLPKISFVGGGSQDFLFHVYFLDKSRPFGLAGCDCNFSIVKFQSRTDDPVVSKTMTPIYGDDGIMNVLSVTLDPADTVELDGSYIYQIIIRDIDGEVESPQQGIIYINSNINRGFLR